MAILKSSIPYATALYKLSGDTNQLDATKKDILWLKDILKNSVELRDFISNPTFSIHKSKETIQNIFSTHIQVNTLNFLYLLIQKKRINQLESICDTFVSIYNEAHQVSDVKLTTAVAISDEVKAQIASHIVKNSNSVIENIVNPNIMGGYIVEFDNKILDNSLANKLNKIKNNFI